MATSPVAAAVLQPPRVENPGLHHRTEQFHIANGAEPDAFLKAPWRYDVAVAGNATEDQCLAEFHLHYCEDFVRVESKATVILGTVELILTKIIFVRKEPQSLVRRDFPQVQKPFVFFRLLFQAKAVRSCPCNSSGSGSRDPHSVQPS